MVWYIMHPGISDYEMPYVQMVVLGHHPASWILGISCIRGLWVADVCWLMHPPDAET